MISAVLQTTSCGVSERIVYSLSHKFTTKTQNNSTQKREPRNAFKRFLLSAHKRSERTQLQDFLAAFEEPVWLLPISKSNTLTNIWVYTNNCVYTNVWLYTVFPYHLTLGIHLLYGVRTTFSRFRLRNCVFWGVFGWESSLFTRCAPKTLVWQRMTTELPENPK